MIPYGDGPSGEIREIKERLRQAVGGNAHSRCIWLFESLNPNRKSYKPPTVVYSFLVRVGRFELPASWTQSPVKTYT